MAAGTATLMQGRPLARWLEWGLPPALIALTWAGIVWHLHDERAQFIRDTSQDSRIFALTYAEHVELSIEALDQALMFLRTSYERDPAHFDIAAEKSSNYTLRTLGTDVSVVNRDGILALTSIAGPHAVLDVSNREHFQFHKDRAGDALFISKPMVGRLSHKVALRFTRRLSAPDGSFAGVIEVVLAPDKLIDLSNAIDIGHLGVVGLVGLDGVIRARVPAIEHAPETSDAGLPVGYGILTEMPVAGESDTADRVSAIDHVARIMSFRRIPGFDLGVYVGLSVDEILAPYRRDRSLIYGMGSALTLLFGAAGAIAAGQRRRLERTSVALQATLENIRQGIVMVDAAGRVPVINRRAIELLGLPGYLLGPGLTWDHIFQWQLAADGFSAGIIKGPATDIAEFVRSGGTLTQWERYERRRPNGDILDIQTTQLPEGGAVRTFTDITDIRTNEAAVEAARDAAEASSHARVIFLAMMSHEIRTPMNGVIGMASLLLGTPLSDEQRRLARILHQSAEFLLEIIDDILTFTKLEANEIVLNDTPTAPRDVLQSVVETFELQARSKGIGLSGHVSGAIPALVMVDTDRLRQVLSNLVGNAIKFTSAGNVRIDVTAPVRLDEPVMVWSVTDSGIGIDPVAQAELFQEFWQADRSISRRFGGAGLGLAICRRLVKRMGGTITVQSEPGEGSTFQFTIPLQVAAPPPPVHDSEPDPVAAERPLYVLLAEDNCVNQMVAERVLHQLGHRVDVVADGRAALQAAQDARYDLVLMDMMMPELDGIAATKAIRSLTDPVAAAVPILALTANAFPHDRDMCLEAGMNGFISKPMRPHQLEEAIADALAQAHTPRSPPPEPHPTDHAFDGAVMMQLSEDIGFEAALAVLNTFLEDAPKRLAQINLAADGRDGGTLRHEAHTLKSAAGSVGFMGLAGLGATVQAMAPDCAVEEMRRASAALQDQFDRGRVALAAWQGHHSRRAEAPS